MATKPLTLPRWGETAAGVVGPDELEPIEAKKDSGWTPGEEPPAPTFNWFQRLVYKWIGYLKDAIFVADTGSNLAGVSAQGDASRGALHLVPQAAPTAAVDGDLWVETTTNVAKVRVNGTTRRLVDDLGTDATPVHLTLAANWTVTQGAPSYLLDSTGFVNLMGYANAGAGAGITISTLPVGRRPAHPKLYTVAGINDLAAHIVQILPTGEIQLVSTITTGDSYSLDGCRFTLLT